MRRPVLHLVFLVLLCGDKNEVMGTTLYNTFPTPGIFGFSQLGITEGQFAAMSFTLNQDHTNVTISPYISGPSQSSITAWLTTAIGPTTTAANLIASETASYLSSQAFVSQPLLTSLNLSAGTYYLVLSSTATPAVNGLLGVFCADLSTNIGHCSPTSPIPPGLSLISIAGSAVPSSLNSIMPYASDFVVHSPSTTNQSAIFPSILITAEESSTVIPEPSTVILFSIGSVVLFGYRRLRRVLLEQSMK